MSKQELAGRAAIVTGSGKNIGRSIALALAEKGAAVVVNGSKDRDAVERVVGEIRNAGGQAHGVMADISQDADAARLVAACARSFGSVDILVSRMWASAAISRSSTSRRPIGTPCCAPT